MRTYYRFSDLQKYFQDILTGIPNYEGSIEFLGNPYWFAIFGINVRRYVWSNEIFIDPDGDSVILAEYRLMVTKGYLERWIKI